MLNPHVHDSDIHEGSQSLLYIATLGSAYVYNRVPCVQLLHIDSMLMLIIEESVYTSPAET